MSLVKSAVEKVRENGPHGFCQSVRYRCDNKLFRYWLYDCREIPRGTRLYIRLNPWYIDGDPFSLHYFNPDDIEFVSPLKPRRFYGWVNRGDWDLNPDKRFEEKRAYRGIKQYIERGDTTILRDLFESYVGDRETTQWGHNSVSDFDSRIKEIDRLIELIRNHGYRSQRNLPSKTAPNNNEPIPDVLNEVTVDINRNGQPLWNGYGSHRLSIAKLLDVDEIPVIVATRHPEANEIT